MMQRPSQQQQGPRMGGPMGGPMMGAPVAKARDFKGTMKKLIEYLGAYRSLIIIVFIFAVLSTAASIAGPKILGNATTKLFEGVMAELNGTGEIDFAYIGRIALITLGLYLVSALFAYIQGWIMANVSTDIAYRFRRDLSEKMNRMPLRYFDGTTHGEVLSRITNDVDTLNQTLSQSLTQIITSLVTVVGVLIMMLS
ncbi:MAG: ABC transporter transmembrane domain-containing protein, partial [Anaerolineae bacterium]